MMNRAELKNEQLEQVAGGWDESQFNAEEAERFYGIRNKLEMVKDGSLILSENEIDGLLKKLYAFENEMTEKYDMLRS